MVHPERTNARAASPRGSSAARRLIFLLAILACGVSAIWIALDPRPPALVASAPKREPDDAFGAVDARLSEAGDAAALRTDIAAPLGAPARHAPSSAAPVEGGRIRGRVLEMWGAPIPELSVWLLPADFDAQARYLAGFEQPTNAVATDARGEFEFAGIAPGPWLVGPAPPRDPGSTDDEQAIAPMAMLVELRAGEPAPEIAIRVQRGLVIRGRVLRPDGEPASSAVVTARSADAPGRRFARVRDGAFALGPLVGGQYELWADSEEEGTTSAVVLAFAGDGGALLQLREGGTLCGRVVDPRGAGASAIEVCAMRQDVEPHEALRVPVQSDKSFRIGNVAPGTYQVVVQSGDAWFAMRSGVEVESRRETADLSLELRQGGRIAIEHASSALVHVAIEHEGMRVLWDALEERRTTVSVPAGRVRVRWSTGSRGWREHDVEIIAGREHELALSDR